MQRSSGRLRSALLLAGLVLACGGDNLTLPSQGEPAVLAPVGGDRQNGTVGEALTNELVVEVRDRFADPVPGVLVRWTAEGGGSVDPAESTTDGRGRAATRRILGSAPTTYVTIAAVEGLEDARFTSTALTARLVITSQLQAIAVSGVPLDPQPALQLQDADGLPVAREGVVVTVAILSGGASLSGTTNATSNAAGEIVFTDLAINGSPGTQRLIFAADPEDFAPVTSSPIALGAGAPALMELVAGDDQNATVGQAVPIAPAVRVRDAQGTPLPGIPVTFMPVKGGGTVVDATPVTDADGVATVGAWRLGTAVGENELSAQVIGQDLEGSPVVFTASATSGGVSASASQVEAAPATITASNGASAATITVRVRDQFGNPVAGVPVTLEVNGSGNTLTQPGEATDANGVATGRLSSTAAGARTVSATAGGLALEQTAAVTVQPGTPSAAASSATVPAAAQSGVPTTIEIQLRDAFGNPVAGRASAIAVAVTGGNTVPGITSSDLGGGLYQASYTPIVAGTDQVDVRVSGAPVTGSPFSSSVAPGPVSAAASTAEVTWNFFTVSALVTARDAQGNPVGRGGDVVVVTPEGFAATTATDNGNGTYSATIATFSAPPVTITLNGAPIQGSPFVP